VNIQPTATEPATTSRQLCPTCGTNLKNAQPGPKVGRRIECEGGCGAWWYHASRGRARRWCPRCYQTHRRLSRMGMADTAPKLPPRRR